MNCDCHSEPMFKHHGYWCCSVKSREQKNKWKQNNLTKAKEISRRWMQDNQDKILARLAHRLQQGERIYQLTNHHRAMAFWKHRLNDPRPRGLTLSRVCPGDCSDKYEGLRNKKPYTLCLNIKHYVWESHRQNISRNAKVGA